MDSSLPQNKTTTTGDQLHHQPKSSSELFASAKVMAESAQAAYGKKTVDKEEAADAASDLLGGARQYGKLDEGQFGQYVEKAEIYLDKYQSSDQPSAATHGGATAGDGATAKKQSEGTAHSSSEQSEGGYGEYFKVAEGFMKKSDGDGKAESGSGNYLKMAEGFFKK